LRVAAESEWEEGITSFNETESVKWKMEYIKWLEY
jgi:hypothetical protein